MGNSNRFVTKVALIVALGGFLMGFDASVISGVNKFIQVEFDLSDLELGLAVSSLSFAATVAMLLSGPLSDRFGRKKILSLAAILYGISAIGSALAPNFTFLVIARMLGGLGVGASLIIAPMYIAEIAPAKQRGRLVSFNQLNIVIGISAAFFSNYIILKLGQSNAGWAQALNFESWNWRWMLGVETLPAIMYFFGLFIVPRSPRWLLMHNYTDEAEGVMSKALGAENAALEIQKINASIHSESKKEKSKISELFKPAMKLVLLIGIVIGVLQQITGINSVFFYAPMIFEQSGIGTDASFIQAIFVGIINLVFTLLAIYYIDKIGRKPLLIIGVTGIAISMLVLSYGFNAASYTLEESSLSSLPSAIPTEQLQSMVGQTYNSDLTYKQALISNLGQETVKVYESALISNAANINSILILICILGFVASFAISVGPVMWVLFSELFPNKIRGLAISFVGLINSLVATGVTFIFPWELQNLGSSITFLIYGVFAVLGLIFIIKVVPETKGKSLEELEQFLVKDNKA